MKKTTNYQTGLWSEMIAALYLICHGYWLLAWRYKTKHGEIDLVMRRGRMLAFVEVKARAGHLDGLLAITPKGQQRIANAALQFIKAHPRYKNYVQRLDALVVTKRGLPYHVKNAWHHIPSTTSKRIR